MTVKAQVYTPQTADQRRIDQLERAIRDHRATRAPKEWSEADAALYRVLAEVREAQRA